MVAHGDYGDPYVTKQLDFMDAAHTADVKGFLDDVKGTFGGDWAECYELVLYQVRI